MQKYDVCIIGSGAGAGGVAYELCMNGYTVCILEKGSFVPREEFSKDEIAYTKRDIFTPNPKEEYHEIQEYYNGKWQSNTSYDLNWSLFNGNMVGGASNFMSGFFHRLRPDDFVLLSKYGKIKGANISNWPISYEDLEPYYTKVESIVGISGQKNNHKNEAPRHNTGFLYPPLQTHKIAKKIDEASNKLGYTTIQTPRAILSTQKDDRKPCYYSNYCGSFACSSGAKGSSREAMLKPALKTNNLTIITNAQAINIEESNHKITHIKYIKNGEIKDIKAKIFVISAGTVESIRLLLNSKSQNFPNGMGNNYNQVGKNVISTSGGMGSGEFDSSTMPLSELMTPGLFINRSNIDWYYMQDQKGGLIDFLWEHANPITKANKAKRDDNGYLLLGENLQKNIYHKLTQTRRLGYETFIDWLPTDNTNITLSKLNDKYGINVAKLRFDMHPHDIKIAKLLDDKAQKILKTMGAKDIKSSISESPSPNLIAGGCRFGNDKKTSVLDKNCKVHDIDNLFVVDGSFMPTGGSVPYTWTIYANSLRIGEWITKIL